MVEANIAMFSTLTQEPRRRVDTVDRADPSLAHARREAVEPKERPSKSDAA